MSFPIKSGHSFWIKFNIFYYDKKFISKAWKSRWWTGLKTIISKEFYILTWMVVIQVPCKTMLDYTFYVLLCYSSNKEFYFFKEPAHLYTTQDSIS